MQEDDIKPNLMDLLELLAPYASDECVFGVLGISCVEK